MFHPIHNLNYTDNVEKLNNTEKVGDYNSIGNTF